MKSDELLALRGIIHRILGATDSGTVFQSLRDSDTESAGDVQSSTGGGGIRRQVDRLEQFPYQSLDPDVFRPSPSEWWRGMCDAADYLAAYHEHASEDLLWPRRFTLSSGLRDIRRGLNRLTSSDPSANPERLTPGVADMPKGNSQIRTDLQSVSARTDLADMTSHARDRAEKCDMLKTLLLNHHFEFGKSLVNKKPLRIADMVSKSNGGLTDQNDGFRTLKALFNPTGKSGGHGLYKALLKNEPDLLHSKLWRDVWSNPAAVEYRDELHSEGRRL